MINPEVYRALGLSDEEFKKILDILGREPSPTELAMFSVEWSEHCGYCCSRKFLKRLPKAGKYSSMVGEDSGGIYVDDLAIVFKMESHNHPSQVEPKQGAATGVGGIIRDIFTAGARPIASLDSLRFGPLDQAYNRYLLRGVVEGIQFYGNCIGIPTIGGEIYFDDAYSGNCLVNAMTIGVCKKDKLVRARAVGVGNSIIYVGSSTGRDGIGGCSVLASHEFKEGEEKRPTVQIGDPFTEKCLIEATLEALATGFIVGIKDMGAAGLTCSSSEMAAAGEVGIDMNLDMVPRREENMEPWEVLMSESQERMLACVTKGKEEEILHIFRKWDLNAEVIGTVVPESVIRIKHKGEVVAELDPQDLANAPQFDLAVEEPAGQREMNSLDLSSISIPKNCNQTLLTLLGVPSIASKRWVYEQYDHMVQTNTTVLPGSDAAVIRLKGTRKALAATTDCNSRYCHLTPYRGAQIAIAEASRNLVCSGALPAAVTDCLNFGNPKKPDRYWHFQNCLEGIINACTTMNLPVVSGNVSFYNESPKAAIYPTPTIGMIGVVQDARKVCTQVFKQKGHVVVLLGKNKTDLGGTEYLKQVHGLVKGEAPELDLDLEQAVQTTTLECIQKDLVASAHDCSEGGLAVALAECCMSGEKTVGAKIDLADDLRLDALLFGESQSRVVLSCSKDKLAKIKALAAKHKAPLAAIGTVGGDNLEISFQGKKAISVPVAKMRDTWANALEKALKAGEGR